MSLSRTAMQLLGVELDEAAVAILNPLKDVRGNPLTFLRFVETAPEGTGTLSESARLELKELFVGVMGMYAILQIDESPNFIFGEGAMVWCTCVMEGRQGWLGLDYAERRRVLGYEIGYKTEGRD